MSDRVIINLQREIKDTLETRDEYKKLLLKHPRPSWSFEVKIEFEALLHLLKRNLDYMFQQLDRWKAIAEETMDQAEKKIEYKILYDWQDKNATFLIEVAEVIINEGVEYLQHTNTEKLNLENDLQKLWERKIYLEKTFTSPQLENTVKIEITETAVIDDLLAIKITTETDDNCNDKLQQSPILKDVNYHQLMFEGNDVEISSNDGSNAQKEFQCQNKFDKPPSSLTTVTDVTVERSQETLKKCIQDSLLLPPDHLTVMVEIPPGVVFKQDVSGVQKEFQRQNKYDRPPSTLATVIDAIVDPCQEELNQCPQKSSILHTKCLPSINMIKNLLSVQQDVTATDTSKYIQEYPVVEIEQQLQIPSVQKHSSGTKVFVNQSDKIIHVKTFKRQHKLRQVKQNPKLRVCFSSQQRHCKVNEYQTPSTFWSREWLVKHSKKFPQLWLEKICITLKEKLVHSATDELKTEFVIQPKLECLKQWKDKPPEIVIDKTSKKDEQQRFIHIYTSEENKIDLESVTDPDHLLSCRRECREEASRICIISRQK